MTENNLDPEQARLWRKYIDPPSTAAQAVITADAEQLSQTVLDTHAACEVYNEQHRLAWLTLDLPQSLRDCISRYSAKLGEARSRDSWNADSWTGARLVSYFDDRNSHDEATGWPPYDPDNPHQQNIPFGHIVSDPTTVHVLRGGTEPLFDARDGQGHYERPGAAEDRDDLPDWGHGYDFATFTRTAERRHIMRFCDLRSPDGCGIGIGGGNTRLAAIPLGRHIYMVSLCQECRAVLEAEFAEAHPNWRGPNPMSKRRRGL